MSKLQVVYNNTRAFGIRAGEDRANPSLHALPLRGADPPLLHALQVGAVPQVVGQDAPPRGLAEGLQHRARWVFVIFFLVIS